MLFWVLPQRSTRILREVMKSNYTRCHIELIIRSCGGWLVSTMLV